MDVFIYEDGPFKEHNPAERERDPEPAAAQIAVNKYTFNYLLNTIQLFGHGRLGNLGGFFSWHKET